MTTVLNWWFFDGRVIRHTKAMSSFRNRGTREVRVRCQAPASASADRLKKDLTKLTDVGKLDRVRPTHRKDIPYSISRKRLLLDSTAPCLNRREPRRRLTCSLRLGWPPHHADFTVVLGRLRRAPFWDLHAKFAQGHEP